MKTAHFSLASLLVLALGTVGCTDTILVDVEPAPPAPPEPTPILDGPYHVAVQQRTTTCAEVGGAPGEVYTLPDSADTLDLFAHPFEDRHDVLFADAPFYTELTDLRVNAGSINGVYEVVEEGFSATLTVTNSAISLGSVQFNVSETYVLGESYELDTAYVCTDTAHVVGFRRPLNDASAIDGYYDGFTEVGRNGCPLTDEVERIVFTRFEIANTGDEKVRFDLNEGDQVFRTPVEGTTVHHEEYYQVGHHGIGGTALLEVDGTFDLPSVHMFVTNSAEVNGEACGQVNYLAGTKRIANPDFVDNDYRTIVTSKVVGDCPFDDATFTQQVRVSLDIDGSVLIKIGAGDTQKLPSFDDAGHFSEVFRTVERDGRDFKMSGDIVDGELKVTTQLFHPATDERGSCAITNITEGLIRYVE